MPIPNPGGYAVDYIRTLDKPNPYSDDPRTYTIREHKLPNRENPNTDYVKLLLMVVGAVATGFAYDYWKQRKHSNPDEIFQLGDQEARRVISPPAAVLPAAASRTVKFRAY